MIYIVMGPSGAGKTLVGEYLKKKGLPELVSHTTRVPREGEKDGIAYHFVDEKTFHSIDKVEESIYAGQLYGVSRKEVEEKRSLGDVFAVTEIQGALAFKHHYGSEVCILYIKSSPRYLRQRMKERGDTKESIGKRMRTYLKKQEAHQGKVADVVLVNETSTKTLYKQIDGLLRRRKIHQH